MELVSGAPSVRDQLPGGRLVAGEGVDDHIADPCGVGAELDQTLDDHRFGAALELSAPFHLRYISKRLREMRGADIGPRGPAPTSASTPPRFWGRRAHRR